MCCFQSPGEACHSGFLIHTQLFSLLEEVGTLSLRMDMILFRGALVLILSITYWLKYRTFNLLAQILHPAGVNFVAIDLWAFPA